MAEMDRDIAGGEGRDRTRLTAIDRVRAAAADLGLEVAIREMPDSTRTAEEAAAACGCEVARIVKSLVFRGHDTGRPILLLVSGRNRVDVGKASAKAGETLDRPDAAYVRETTGFAIGGIPPFGHTTAMRVMMDRDLVDLPTVWAAAGTPRAVFETDPRRLAEAVGAEIVDIAG